MERARIHNPLALLDAFRSLRLLVVGEAMLDRHVTGRVQRLSPEAPVPVVDVQREEVRPGGAGNAAANAAALGAAVELLTIVGDDDDGRVFSRLLRTAGVDDSGVLVQPGRRTLAKGRILAGQQLVVRFDRGDTGPVDAPVAAALRERLERAWTRADAVLVSDYGYGVVDHVLRDLLGRLQGRAPRTLLVDSKDVAGYRGTGVTAVKPNYSQAAALLDLGEAYNGNRAAGVLSRRRDLFEITGAQVVAVTLDSDGAVILEQGGDSYRTYARPGWSFSPAQASGAGDTFSVALALGLAAGGHVGAAAEVAAASSSVVVVKETTAVAFPEEVVGHLAAEDKRVDDLRRLKERVDRMRAAGRRLVFTNGVFDILHAGHISYLNQAKAEGDILLVAVNGDASVRRLKGEGRPVNGLDDRMRVLAGLSSVDLLTPFDEDTPVELIRLLEPDVYVKGGDYSRDTLPEATVVEELGGRVEILPFVADRSTTSTIRRMSAAYAEGRC